jgi:hypothetical protein
MLMKRIKRREEGYPTKEIGPPHVREPEVLIWVPE